MTQISSTTAEPPAVVPTAPSPAGASPDAPLAEAFAALLAGVPVVPAAPLSSADPAEPEPLGGRVLSPVEAFREQARGIVLIGATRPIGVPADATSLPLRPPLPAAEGAPAVPATAPSPSLPIGLGVAGAEVRGEGADAPGVPAPPAVARATRLADVLAAATGAGSSTAAPADDATVPQPATVAGTAAHGQAAAASERPEQSATPAAPATPTSAPATPASPPATAPVRAGVPLPTRVVGLEHAVETVRLALRHGAERGVSHARISLAPRELGGIDVHLRHTPDGLVARVVAEHASAVQQLQQAGAELRRSLEQQGVTLLRLDIGASGDEAAGRRGAAFDTAAAFGERGRGRGHDALASLDEVADADAARETATTLQLPNGALVDVLA